MIGRAYIRKPRVITRGVFISKPSSISALPMALDPDMTAVPVDPMAGYPSGPLIWRVEPVAVDPNISAVTPTIMAFAPNQSCMRRSRPNNDTRWWRRGRASQAEAKAHLSRGWRHSHRYRQAQDCR